MAETSTSTEDTKKLSKADIANLAGHLPHMHVIAHGTKDEALGLLKNMSTPLVKAFTTVAKQGGGALSGFQGTSLDLLKSDERLDRKTTKLRKMADDSETGGGFVDTMSGVAKVALQLAPAILPLLL